MWAEHPMKLCNVLCRFCGVPAEVGFYATSLESAMQPLLIGAFVSFILSCNAANPDCICTPTVTVTNPRLTILCTLHSKLTPPTHDRAHPQPRRTFLNSLPPAITPPTSLPTRALYLSPFPRYLASSPGLVRLPLARLNLACMLASAQRKALTRGKTALVLKPA